jgi:hypothetical protein
MLGRAELCMWMNCREVTYIIRYFFAIAVSSHFGHDPKACKSSSRDKGHCVIKHSTIPLCIFYGRMRTSLTPYADKSEGEMDGNQCAPFISLKCSSRCIAII